MGASEAVAKACAAGVTVLPRAIDGSQVTGSIDPEARRTCADASRMSSMSNLDDPNARRGR